MFRVQLFFNIIILTWGELVNALAIIYSVPVLGLTTSSNFPANRSISGLIHTPVSLSLFEYLERRRL
jgi:hypothetical protein